MLTRRKQAVRELRTLTGQSSWIKAVAVTRHEQRAISDNSVRLWELERERCSPR